MTRIAPLYLSDRTLFRSDRRMSILNGSILKSRIKEFVPLFVTIIGVQVGVQKSGRV